MTLPDFDRITTDRLPEPEVLFSLCQWMGLAPEFTSLLMEALPALQADPAVAERFPRDCHHYRTCSDYEKFRPTEAEALSFYYAFVHFASLPTMRNQWLARGIPETQIQITAGEFDRWLHRYREQHGVWGFDLINWSSVYAQGRLAPLGRLGFEVIPFPAFCHLPEKTGTTPLLQAGDPVISVHIPAKGALTPADCDHAFALAREFFPRYFPEHNYKAFICVSWMMDRQLALYLPPESNLIHFQNRFQPAVVDNANDDSFWSFIFNIPKRPANLTDMPRDTRLRRIMLEHIEKGNAWQIAAGYIPR